MKLISFRIALVLAIPALRPCGASLAIEQISFHRATYSQTYTEDYPADNGGVMFVFVRNGGSAPASVTDVRINGRSVEDLQNNGTVSWWRIWPPSVPPGGVSTVTVKAGGTPLSEGSGITVSVLSSGGQTATASATLTTPKLRLGAVVPSTDWRTVYIFLRNLDTAPYTVTQLFLNDDVTSRAFFPGGSAIAPNSIGIAKVSFAAPLAPLTPLAVRLRAVRPGGEEIRLGAPVRLVEPWFPVGSWSSSMATSATGQEQSRQTLLDTVTGSNDWAAIRQMADRFFIRSFNIINTGDPKYPDPAVVAAQTGNPDIRAWYLRDEPDLNGVPVLQIKQGNDILWTDPSHPSFLNLTTTRAFSTYGHIPDIIGPDHYVMYAPNNIPGTGITRFARMEEAIEFAEQLKLNTEPKIMWNWSQLAAPPWNRQPEPWGVNYQFWANVMTGARGILWFKVGPVTISFSMHQDSQVFVIGAEDTTPPAAPQRVCIARYDGAGACLLSWEEPFDDTGIRGYRVYANGQQVADVREPLAAVSGLTEPEEVDFTVRAYDAAGNVSEPSAPVRWLTWRFDMPGYLEGWQMANQVVSPQVAGGSLQFDIGGNDPYVISPQLRADTSRYRYLRIRMRNSTTATLGQVFFSTEAEPGYSEERTATFSLFANDALFTDYFVDLGANPRWTGTATQIRLDPVANASSGRILIAEVQLQPWPGPDAVPPAGPVLINGGAPYTNSPAVTLTLTASDASGVVASQFSHNGVSWTAWEPFTPSRSWNLVNLDGTRQVFARFRDPYGNVSPAVSASIVLDRVAPPTPSQPSGTSPFTNDPEVTFTWSTVADALSGTAGYICRVGTTPGGTDVFNGYVGNTLRKSITGESGRTYYCRVQAVDNAGNIGGLSAVSVGVLVDTEPPAPPSVPADAGVYTTSRSVHLQWNAPADPGGSGIQGYDLQVGSAPDAGDVFSGDVGNSVSWSIAADPGRIYFGRVRARDRAGNTGPWSPSSDGVAVVETAGLTPAAAKLLPDGASAGISAAVVSQVSGPDVWMQDEGRAAGPRVRLIAPSPGLAPGSRAEARGVLGTLPDGERVLQGVAGANGQGPVPAPLGISNAALGGGDWFYDAQTGAGQAGVTGSTGTGNIGLRVRIWGRVTAIDRYAQFFLITDGSGVADASGQTGVRVSGPVPAWLQTGDTVAVTGVSSCFRRDGRVWRQLLTSTESAVTPL